MGEDDERLRVIFKALHSSWPAVRRLLTLAVACLTFTGVAWVVISTLDDRATEVGGPTCDVSGSDCPDSGEPLPGIVIAATLGAVAALITAIGTATAKVIIALAQLRLANASSDAIRSGHQPPTTPPVPGQDDEDGATPSDPA